MRSVEPWLGIVADDFIARLVEVAAGWRRPGCFRLRVGENGTMSPRPVCRWKSFWLGMWVIAFLGWAWVRSMDVVASLNLSEKVAVASGGGGISVAVIDAPNASFGRAGMGFRPVIPGGRVWFPPAVWPLSLGSHGDGFAVAYWYLILLFVVPLSGWFAWRWQRMKRLDVSGKKLFM